ncbi:MAG TPA: hypothetical protein VGO11_02725 [Chthoniobacteraceae bacterium]|nr:hypothetical protein [Chthoniobacteraceae bacterium]
MRNDILLEPPHWADLRLISRAPLGRMIWVVEVKAGAYLQSKQNPSSEEFYTAPAGYGWLFRQSEPADTKLRYIVLGANEPLTLPSSDDRLRISVRASTWAQVAETVSWTGQTDGPSSVVRDFFRCLAKFQLSIFPMLEAQNISVKRGLAGLGPALTLLQGVCTWSGAKWKTKNLTSFPNDTGCVIGVYLKPEVSEVGVLGRLQSVCDHPGYVAWIGYYVDADDVVSRSVWFYFQQPETRDRVLAKMQQRFPTAQANNEDDGIPAIEIIGAQEEGHPDLAWFQSTFNAVIEWTTAGFQNSIII